METEYRAKVERFAAMLAKAQAMSMQKRHPSLDPNSEYYMVHVHYGRKYARVDIGTSGRYMVATDGTIYGIKAYGVPHPGYRFGTLDSIDRYDWSGYYAA